MTFGDWLMAGIVGIWLAVFGLMAWPKADKPPRENVRKEKAL